MAAKIYNPLTEELIDMGIVKTLPTLVKCKDAKGLPSTIMYYPKEEFAFIIKGQAKIFGASEHYLLNEDTIDSMYVLDSSQKIEKSIVKRAIVGGLLTGGVGAIVGGMTGLKDGYKYFKKVTINERFDFVFEEKEYPKIGEFFEKMAQKISKKIDNAIAPAEEKKVDYIAMLKDLKGLADAGIITMEEFEEKKKDLLSKI